MDFFKSINERHNMSMPLIKLAIKNAEDNKYAESLYLICNVIGGLEGSIVELAFKLYEIERMLKDKESTIQ